MRTDTRPEPVGQALPHESAVLHVSGAAHYLDDLPELAGTLHAAIGQVCLFGIAIVSWHRDLVAHPVG